MSANYISVAPIADSTPGFSFGRQGFVGSGSYLQIDGVPSNQAGRVVPFATAQLNAVFISCQNSATFTVEVQTRVGNVYTTVYTATVTASRKFTETNIQDIEFIQGDEICLKIGSGSCSNIVVGCVVKGNPL